MATMGSRGFIIQDENLDAHRNKSVLDGNNKFPKAVLSKKSKESVGKIRRPLGDLTNKKQPPLALKLSPKKQQNVKQEGFNIAEEGFLHDHKKCVEAKEAALKQSFMDLVLPKCDIVLSDIHNKAAHAEVDLDAEFEPKEMDMSEFSDWNMGPSPWSSPPVSPVYPKSSPSFMFAWELELPEFSLKDFD